MHRTFQTIQKDKNFFCKRIYTNNGNKLLFYCNQKRYNFYVNNNLAKPFDDGQEGQAAYLLFEPKGDSRTNDEFYLQPIDLICVVCGCDNNLTRHHIVPRSFITEFPTYVKEHDHHDIVFTCIPCHREYTKYESQFVIDLFNKNDIDYKTTDKITYKYSFKDIANCRVGMNKRINKLNKILTQFAIPQHVRDKLTNRLKEEKEFLNLVNNMKDNSEYKQFIQHPYIVAIRKLIDKLGYDEVIRTFRQFFVDTANPKFMPKHWSIDRKKRITPAKITKGCE